MSRPLRLAIAVCPLMVIAATAIGGADPQQSGVAAEQRAIAYLSLEVPNWPRQNHCFSCHNNGDAARALFVARSMFLEVPAESLADTTAWLLRPGGWSEAKGDPGFSDLKLARIQFAAALAEAVLTGEIRDQNALVAAADLLLADQESDGSWDVDVPGVVGSPATYGDVLGTYMARRTLAATRERRFRDAIARADAWFLAAESSATVDVAAVALALADRIEGAGGRADDDGAETQPVEDSAAAAVRAKLGETAGWLIGSQSSDGGWGPYPKSPAEPFDTAVALLALQKAGDAGIADKDTIGRRITGGRSYLIRAQLPAGGWPETTRPSGFQSYAQHISTSGWAALALLKTKVMATR